MMIYTNENNSGSYREDWHGYDDFDVNTHCPNYSPRGNSSIMDMTDYSTCDNCRYQRQDNKCGRRQQTLS